MAKGKMTYQPKKGQRAKEHGFRKRMAQRTEETFLREEDRRAESLLVHKGRRNASPFCY